MGATRKIELVPCAECGEPMKRLAGDDRTACRDRKKCRERARKRPPTPSVADEDPAPDTLPASSESQIAPWLRRKQASLAMRAMKASEKAVATAEKMLDKGVEVVTKDGDVLTAQIPPMALAALVRELRPIVQEPIRAEEAAADRARPPVAIDVKDPAVIAKVISILQENRAKKLASQQTLTLTEGDDV